MCLGWSCNDHGVDTIPPNYVSVFRGTNHIRETCANLAKFFYVPVTNVGYLAFRKPFKATDQVWAPVPEPNHSDSNHSTFSQGFWRQPGHAVSSPTTEHGQR